MTTLSSAPAHAENEKKSKHTEPPVKIRQTKMLINGVWQDSHSGKTFDTLNPCHRRSHRQSRRRRQG